MTWEQLVDWAEVFADKKDYYFNKYNLDPEFTVDSFIFYPKGDVCYEVSLIGENRTYEQMKSIIENMLG